MIRTLTCLLVLEMGAVVSAATPTSQPAPEPAVDETRLLRAELNLLSAQVNSQAKEIEKLKADNARLLEQVRQPAATTPVAAAQAATSRPAERSQDRFAKQRLAREAEVTKEIARLRKAMEDEKKSHRQIAIYGLGTKNLVEWLEVERKEIKEHPGEWAPPLRAEVGSVGRFYRCSEPGRDSYYSAGSNAAHRIKVVQIVNGQNMVAEFGGSLIWLSAVWCGWIWGASPPSPPAFFALGPTGRRAE